MDIFEFRKVPSICMELLGVPGIESGSKDSTTTVDSIEYVTLQSSLQAADTVNGISSSDTEIVTLTTTVLLSLMDKLGAKHLIELYL